MEPCRFYTNGEKQQETMVTIRLSTFIALLIQRPKEFIVLQPTVYLTSHEEPKTLNFEEPETQNFESHGEAGKMIFEEPETLNTEESETLNFEEPETLTFEEPVTSHNDTVNYLKRVEPDMTTLEPTEQSFVTETDTEQRYTEPRHTGQREAMELRHTELSTDTEGHPEESFDTVKHMEPSCGAEEPAELSFDTEKHPEQSDGTGAVKRTEKIPDTEKHTEQENAEPKKKAETAEPNKVVEPPEGYFFGLIREAVGFHPLLANIGEHTFCLLHHEVVSLAKRRALADGEEVCDALLARMGWEVISKYWIKADLDSSVALATREKWSKYTDLFATVTWEAYMDLEEMTFLADLGDEVTFA